MLAFVIGCFVGVGLSLLMLYLEKKKDTNSKERSKDK